MTDQTDPADVTDISAALDRLGAGAVAESPPTPPIAPRLKTANGSRRWVLTAAAAAAAIVVIAVAAAALGPLDTSKDIIADGPEAPAPAPGEAVALTFSPDPARTTDVLQVTITNDTALRWSPQCNTAELSEWDDAQWKRIGGSVIWDRDTLWVYDSEVTLDCQPPTDWAEPGATEVRTLRPDRTRSGSDDDGERRPLEPGRYRLRFPGGGMSPEALGEFVLEDSGLILTPTVETVLLGGDEVAAFDVRPDPTAGSIAGAIGVTGQRRLGLTFTSSCDTAPAAIHVEYSDDDVSLYPMWRQFPVEGCAGEPGTWTVLIELARPLPREITLLDAPGANGRTAPLSPTGTPSRSSILATSLAGRPSARSTPIAAQVSTPFPAPGSTPELALGAAPASSLCVTDALVERFSVDGREVLAMSGASWLIPLNPDRECVQATLRPTS